MSFLKQINPIISKEFDRLITESIRLSNESVGHSQRRDFDKADDCLVESEKLILQAAELMGEATKDKAWLKAAKKVSNQNMN